MAWTDGGWEGSVHRFVLAICCALLASCAGQLTPDDSVRDRDTAIKIGRAACMKGTNLQTFSQSEATLNWRANPYGDYWIVGLGSRYAAGGAEVMVAKRDGKTSECGWWED